MSEDWKDEARKRLKEKASKGRFKLVEGENSIRVLPAAEGAKEKPWLEFRIHRDVGPNKRFVRCGKDVLGNGDCYLCDKLIPKLRKGSKSEKRMADAMDAKDQFVVQVAVLEDGKLRGPHVWYVPTGGPRSLAYHVLQILGSRKTNVVDIKKGRNLNIERTGTGRTDTRYSPIILDDDATPVSEKILAKIKGFEELVAEYSEEQQKSAYRGQDAADIEEDEDDEEEKPKKKKRSRDEDAEEEDTGDDEEKDESDDEESEDEEEAPKKKSKKKSSRDDDDEDSETEEEGESEDSDDEDEGAEGDEEDEAPAKNKSSKKKSRVKDDDDDESDDADEDGEDEEEDRPKKKSKSKKDDDEDEDSESEDEDEDSEASDDDEDEDEPKSKKSKSKKSSDDDEDEESEEEESEDEDDEEEDVPKKTKKSKKSKKS